MMDRILARVEAGRGLARAHRRRAPRARAHRRRRHRGRRAAGGAHDRRQAIAAFTSTGSTALRLARERPNRPILGLTTSEAAARRWPWSGACTRWWRPNCTPWARWSPARSASRKRRASPGRRRGGGHRRRAPRRPRHHQRPPGRGREIDKRRPGGRLHRDNVQAPVARLVCPPARRAAAARTAPAPGQTPQAEALQPRTHAAPIGLQPGMPVTGCVPIRGRAPRPGRRSARAGGAARQSMILAASDASTSAAAILPLPPARPRRSQGHCPWARRRTGRPRRRSALLRLDLPARPRPVLLVAVLPAAPHAPRSRARGGGGGWRRLGGVAHALILHGSGGLWHFLLAWR
jgi:hypothetical protein